MVKKQLGLLVLLIASAVQAVAQDSTTKRNQPDSLQPVVQDLWFKDRQAGPSGQSSYERSRGKSLNQNVDLNPIDLDVSSPRKAFNADEFFRDANKPGLVGGVQSSWQTLPNVADPGVSDKLSIVRITGFREDPLSTPTINRDAIAMAQKLLDTKRTRVAILMERTGVMLATTGYLGFYINGDEVDFQKQLKKFVQEGGRIIVNERWAKTLSVQPPDCIAGVEFMDEQNLASEISHAANIFDYAATAYPFGTMTRH